MPLLTRPPSCWVFRLSQYHVLHYIVSWNIINPTVLPSTMMTESWYLQPEAMIWQCNNEVVVTHPGAKWIGCHGPSKLRRLGDVACGFDFSKCNSHQICYVVLLIIASHDMVELSTFWSIQLKLIAVRISVYPGSFKPWFHLLIILIFQLK